MCLKFSVSMVLSRLLVVTVIIFVLAWTNTVLAQTKSDGSEQTSGTSQDAFRRPIAPVSAPSAGSPAPVIPFVTISERFDDNVLFTPTNKVQDFVTNVTAGARLNYRDDMVDGTFRGGLVSEVYVRNPGLNYVGANAALTAVLDNAVGKVVRGLGLRVSDAVSYSPRSQAFITPEAPVNSFINGIQAFRNNTLTNATNVLSTYALNPLDQVRASYSYQMIRFFNDQPVSGAVGGLFNSDVHTLLTGVEHQLNPSDSIGGSYQYQQMAFAPNTGGPSAMVSVNSAMATWKNTISRELRMEVSPGASILSSLPGQPQWTLHASLAWSDTRTAAGVSFYRDIFPGFFFAGSAIRTDGVTLTLSRILTSQWTVGAQSDYASSRALGGGGSNLQFKSFGERAFLNYTFYPGLIASASATYNHFTFGQVGSENQLIRQTVTLTLTAEWN